MKSTAVALLLYGIFFTLAFSRVLFGDMVFPSDGQLAYFFKEDSDAYQPRALYGATCLAILSLWTAVGFGWRYGAERLQNEALTESLGAMQSNIDLVEMVVDAVPGSDIGVVVHPAGVLAPMQERLRQSQGNAFPREQDAARF